MKLTTQQAITSAEQAATDSLNRYLDDMCEVEEEKELFDFQMLEKTLEVVVNYNGHYFEPFGRNNRPSEARCILELIQEETFSKEEYRIVVKPHATGEMIQADLTMLVLPF
ncbi:MAG: hypothetical protein AAGJ18_06615 [Bacteroidota bacterium]